MSEFFKNSRHQAIHDCCYPSQYMNKFIMTMWFSHIALICCVSARRACVNDKSFSCRCQFLLSSGFSDFQWLICLLCSSFRYLHSNSNSNMPNNIPVYTIHGRRICVAMSRFNWRGGGAGCTLRTQNHQRRWVNRLWIICGYYCCLWAIYVMVEDGTTTQRTEGGTVAHGLRMCEKEGGIGRGWYVRRSLIRSWEHSSLTVICEWIPVDCIVIHRSSNVFICSFWPGWAKRNRFTRMPNRRSIAIHWLTRYVCELTNVFLSINIP